MSQSALRLFLDTADRAAWARFVPTGAFFGLTTNPTILEAAGLRCELPVIAELVRDALAHGFAEVHVQTFGRDVERLVRHGAAIAAIDRRVVVKVALTFEGAVAARRLVELGVPVTTTAVYAPHQVVTSAALGARYAAPYLGRITDMGRDGFAELATMQRAIRGLASPMRLLVASVRSPGDLARLAAEGVDTFTVNPKIAAALFAEEATDAAAEAFERAAEARPAVRSA